jgi:hypothetical protein
MELNYFELVFRTAFCSKFCSDLLSHTRLKIVETVVNSIPRFMLQGSCGVLILRRRDRRCFLGSSGSLEGCLVGDGVGGCVKEFMQVKTMPSVTGKELVPEDGSMAQCTGGESERRQIFRLGDGWPIIWHSVDDGYNGLQPGCLAGWRQQPLRLDYKMYRCVLFALFCWLRP